VDTPATSQIADPPAASDMVTGSRSSRSGSTGFWVRKEYPKHGAGQCTVVGPVL
jgi:hypothetical protein